MIIECINCNKKFNVNSELIPIGGRTIQCGSCNHVWFFKKENLLQKNVEITKKKISSSSAPIDKKKSIKSNPKASLTKISKKGSEIVKYHPRKKFSFSIFLSYILVLIVTFIALILILDTIKTYLYDFFPNLEFFLFSFYETLKDIELFIKDLI